MQGKKALKILGFIAIGLLLFVGVAAIGINYFMKSIDAELKLGTAWGNGKSAKECLLEAHKRAVSCGDGLTCEPYAEVFFSGCLDVASRGPDYCKGVPSIMEFAESIAWRISFCETNGLDAGGPCAKISGEAQKLCTK